MIQNKKHFTPRILKNFSYECQNKEHAFDSHAWDEGHSAPFCHSPLSLITGTQLTNYIVGVDGQKRASSTLSTPIYNELEPFLTSFDLISALEHFI